jgi:hypothetical protein
VKQLRRAGFTIACGVLVAFGVVPMSARPAGALRTAHAPAFAGTYQMKLTTGGKTFRSQLRVRTNGSCDDTSRDGVPVPCTWSNQGAQFTLRARSLGVRLVGTRTLHGISSKRHPGTGYINDQKYATWYAVKAG